MWALVVVDVIGGQRRRSPWEASGHGSTVVPGKQWGTVAAMGDHWVICVIYDGKQGMGRGLTQ